MLIGVLGAGQLGMMLAQAGKTLGHSFRFLDPAPDSPASKCGEHIVAPYDDREALTRFARGLDLATWEFENVPCESVRRLADRIPVRPAVALLELAQDRLLEKRLFEEIGLRPAPHAPVSSRLDLEHAARSLGLPCILKTRRMGYDGKGQFVLRRDSDIDRSWNELGPHGELVLEGFVEFECEVSLIACRGLGSDPSPRDQSQPRGAEIVFYPMPVNVHRDGILRVSRVGEGAELEPELEREAHAAVSKLLDGFGYTGVLTVEFFVVRRGSNGRGLIANEIAPRVHNSGHWSIEGATASQFENHCRAITGTQLGSPSLKYPAAAMLNIVGEEPDPSLVRSIPGASIHMYGKQPRPGRKLGHITISGSRETVDEGVRRAGRLPGVG